MKVLLVPSIRASMGSGHLKRTLRLTQILGPQSAVLLEGLDDALGSTIQTLLEPLGVDPSACRVLECYDPKEGWDLVILDRRSSDVEQILRFFPTPVVGLDEGGSARRCCSYLIDTFPVFRQRHRANLTASSLLDLAEHRRAEHRPVEHRRRAHLPLHRVLISFGGEDPADLSSRLLELLLLGGFFKPVQITVVQGPYFRRRRWPEGITVLRDQTDLKSLLGEYDLVFCSFGLTAYEALAAGVPVINLNPSAYHRRLSNVAGIPEIGVRRPAVRRLKRMLADPQVLWDLLSRYPPETFFASPRLCELPARLQPSGPARCPICGQTANPALARFEKRSYFRCRGCGMIYLLGFGQNSVRYDEGYFFSRYVKQYGKTYLEDFQNIKGAAAVRLKQIRRLVRPAGRPTAAQDPAVPSAATLTSQSSDPRLLDVGCAFGPFLQAASEQGFQTHGLDVAEEAVRYVRGQLGIPCGLGDFSAADGLREVEGVEMGFDVITMWYVVEHFRDAGAVLRRVNALLRQGGVFAFSTPNASGISARKQRTRFLQSSPQDHYTVWPLRSTAGILGRYGFQLRKIVVTGHHGERFLWPGELTQGSGIAGGFSVLSRLLRLGDTFEAYAVKGRDLR